MARNAKESAQDLLAKYVNFIMDDDNSDEDDDELQEHAENIKLIEKVKNSTTSIPKENKKGKNKNVENKLNKEDKEESNNYGEMKAKKKEEAEKSFKMFHKLRRTFKSDGKEEEKKYTESNSDERPQRFECDKCAKYFMTEEELKKHTKMAKTIRWVCSLSGKVAVKRKASGAILQ